MTDTTDTTRGQSPVERILLHIVQAVTVAGIIGGYVAMSDLKTSNAVMQTELRTSNASLEAQIRALSERLDDFRQLSADRYTATQAARDIKPILDRIADHEARIRQLERQLNAR